MFGYHDNAPERKTAQTYIDLLKMLLLYYKLVTMHVFSTNKTIFQHL